MSETDNPQTENERNPDPGVRWEQGIPHHPRSKAMFDLIARYDFERNNDYFCWKSGGDGDNGETLMYVMDMIFTDEDSARRRLMTDHTGLAPLEP